MIVVSLLKVITQLILKYAFISFLLPWNSLYITTRLVSAENKLKGVWCFGKGWVILGSKLDGCFWFDVGILLYLNYESFFLPFLLSFPYFVISCSGLTFSSSITSDLVCSARWMLASSISTLFECSSSTIPFSKIFPNTNSVVQFHLCQLHLIMQMFYCF